MHPYKALPSKSFWKTSISETNFLEYSDLYRKKFAIAKTDRVVTSGSCFAQHIARRLRASGFDYRDYEEAPPELPEALRKTYGYDIYSARYGNIYTARQLLQTFQRAFEGRQPVDPVWCEDGRFYDPFRPTVEPQGFASRDECDAALATHLAAVRRVFTESDLFIFTLGLTEAWFCVDDGSVYPVCPGTAAGQFDPMQHKFRNFGFVEIITDLQQVIASAKAINPGLRFLLTVSPVPLTATATDQHVLVATIHSKSVLRAVAGELAAKHDFVDYFPSYELVASHPTRGMLYDPNLRTVANRGVDVVMQHLFAEHNPGGVPGALPDVAAAEETAPEPTEAAEQEEDVVCEEILLAEGR